MPSFTTLRATRRRMGSRCSARYTVPIPLRLTAEGSDNGRSRHDRLPLARYRWSEFRTRPRRPNCRKRPGSDTSGTVPRDRSDTQFLSALRAVWHLDQNRSSHFTPFVPDAVTFSAAIPYSWQVSRIGRSPNLVTRKENRHEKRFAHSECWGWRCSARPSKHGADCQQVRGSDVETIIPSNDPLAGSWALWMAC